MGSMIVVLVALLGNGLLTTAPTRLGRIPRNHGCLLCLGMWFLFTPCLATDSLAAHPLVTDDTGTQGRGNFQLEATVEYEHDKDDGVTTITTEGATTLTYGIADSWDIVLGIPYQIIKTKDEDGPSKVDGIADVSMEIKWRFYEQDGLSFALKPGMTFPTGNYKRGLGSGKVAYDLFLIATVETDPWAFYFNLGYFRNSNRLHERRNLWFGSAAATVEVARGLNLAVNIGAERNTDRDANTDPAFILGGLIYSLWKDFDIDIGVKKGITNPETAYTVTGGVTWRF